jgi:hypothetical protein
MVLRYAHPSEEHRFTAIKKMEELRLSKGLMINLVLTALHTAEMIGLNKWQFSRKMPAATLE